MSNYAGVSTSTREYTTIKRNMVVKMYNRIPESIVKQVQNAHNIADLIGEDVQLTKRGNNYFGLCPFHDENTPSFSVSAEKQLFYCFGCKETGNVFSFLMKHKGLSFVEAVNELAERANINIPQIGHTNKETSAEARQILEANEWITKLYHHLVRFTKEGNKAYEYIKSRGINDESIDTFQIGYSPNVKNFTENFLKKKDIHEQILIKSGLFTKTNNELFERFSGRIVFPIRDPFGRPVGFSARTIRDEDPKYINTSETEIFQKQNLLYNFDLAKNNIRRKKEAILFEGQLDVIIAYQGGLKNVIATLGTALTERQAKQLRRYANRVIICYDGDLAGLDASYRAAKLLQNNNFEIKISKLDSKDDPHNFILKNGIDSFKNQILDVSESYIQFYMRYLQREFNVNNEAEKLKYIRKVVKEIASLESSVEREYYLKQLGEQYFISLASLQEELQGFLAENKHQWNNRGKNRYTKMTREYPRARKLYPAFHRAERELISLMLTDEGIALYVQNELGADFTIDEHKIIVTSLYAYYEEGLAPNVGLFLERIKSEELRNLTAEIAMIPTALNDHEEGLMDYISVIKKQFNDVAKINKFKAKQRKAEQEKDPIKAAKIGMKILELQKQLKQSH